MNLLRIWIIAELSKGEPRTAQQIKKKYVERYRNWKKVEIVDQHIYANLDVLAGEGFITLIQEEGEPKRYTFREGCIKGILIARLKLNNSEDVLIMGCGNRDICSIPENNTVREITTECKYYEVYKKLKSMIIPFELRF